MPSDQNGKDDKRRGETQIAVRKPMSNRVDQKVFFLFVYA